MKPNSQTNIASRSSKTRNDVTSIGNSMVSNSKGNDLTDMKSMFSFKEAKNPLSRNVNSKLPDMRNKNEYNDILEEIRGYKGIDASNRKGRRRKSQIDKDRPEISKSPSKSRSRSKSRVEIFRNDSCTETPDLYDPNSVTEYDKKINNSEIIMKNSQIYEKDNIKYQVHQNRVIKPILNLDLRDVKTVTRDNDNKIISPIAQHKPSSAYMRNNTDNYIAANQNMGESNLDAPFKTFGVNFTNQDHQIIPDKPEDTNKQPKSIHAKKVNLSPININGFRESQIKKPFDMMGPQRSKSINNRFVYCGEKSDKIDNNEQNRNIIVFGNSEAKRKSTQRSKLGGLNSSSPKKRRSNNPPLVGIRSILINSEVTPSNFNIPLKKVPESNDRNITEKLRTGLSNIKDKFMDFKSYSCNCELIRLDDKSKIKRML